MSSAEEQSTQAAEAQTEEVSILDQAIAATPQTERSRSEELLKTLAEEAMKGTVTYDRNLQMTINKAIASIDELMSKQLAAVMHHADFQKLEGTWRGLHYLVHNSETGEGMKIKVFNTTKKALAKDLEKASEFDQSALFKKMYENEFGTAGGEPYGALIGDYEISNHPDDIEFLSKMSNIAAAAFCPFITAPAPGLFGMESWRDLGKPRDLAKVFETAEYAKWRSFRESEDSRFVSLAMPRTLARLPFGEATKPIDEFNFEEVDSSKPVDSDEYTWMNTSYVLGARLTDAFAQSGFCTAIRGAEGGGKVENLPAHTFISDDGDVDMACPTEIGITDRREAELSKLGFLSLCHYKNTDYAVFFGGQTANKPKKYDQPDATANAEISARLPYIMATSRFAHYLKVMARDKIGSFMEVGDCQKWLNNWILNYVNSDPTASQETKAAYPLRAAKVEVKEIPGAPGAYNAVAWLQPWLQFEELTTSMRMVAKIPGSGG